MTDDSTVKSQQNEANKDSFERIFSGMIKYCQIKLKRKYFRQWAKTGSTGIRTSGLPE